jgi:signal transduction histidine kinase
MPRVVPTTVDIDFTNGIVDICPHGAFDLAMATALRAAMSKAPREHPYAVLIDLNDVSTVDPLAVIMLPTMSTRLRADATRYAVHVREGAVARAVERVVGPWTPLAHSRDEAIAMIDQSAEVRRRMHSVLPPVPESAIQARALAAYACLTWGLDHVSVGAEQIATELASNAVEHAGTEADITLVVTGDYLIVQVRDHSRVLPALRGTGPLSSGGGGHGLNVVAAMSTAWGAIPNPVGKTVWASLRVQPLPA